MTLMLLMLMLLLMLLLLMLLMLLLLMMMMMLMTMMMMPQQQPRPLDTRAALPSASPKSTQSPQFSAHKTPSASAEQIALPRSLMSAGARKHKAHKAWCEIAISAFDPLQSVHASDDHGQLRRLGEGTIELPAAAGDAVAWIRQAATARLSSGCAVTMEPNAGVDLMHMLQVHRNLLNPNRKPLPCSITPPSSTPPPPPFAVASLRRRAHRPSPHTIHVSL